jgi:hypothetical protein
MILPRKGGIIEVADQDRIKGGREALERWWTRILSMEGGIREVADQDLIKGGRH